MRKFTMRKFWNELLAGKHPAVIAWTGGLIALFAIVPIFSAKYAEFVEQQDAKYKIDAASR
jgi:hypothetical protein